MKYLNLLLIALLSTTGMAQNDEEPLDFELIVAAHNDQVILRWAPANERSWLNWRSTTVEVYRRPLDQSGEDKILPLELIHDNITPWNEAMYEEYANTNDNEDEMVMLAGYLMHAPYVSVNEPMSMQNIVDRREELANKYSTALYTADMNAKAAESLGMRAEDDNADEAAYYTVIVSWENGETSTRTVRFSSLSNLIPAAGMLRGKEMENYITLSWEQAFHKKHFTAYWIEKSVDGEKWQRLNDIPFVHAFDSSLPRVDDDYVYQDSVENYNPHFYRILGISPFGVESKPSEVIRLQGRDRTPPAAPVMVEAIMKDEVSMTISWDMETLSDDLVGFIIKKDNDHEGEFIQRTQLKNKTERSFQDTQPNYLNKNFYKVCSVDTAGNQACALPVYGFINDTIPPSQPTGLSGSIDTSGVVQLTWENNTEIDLSGYHVYLSNRKDGVFSKLTEVSVQGNTFYDTLTLNTLTEDVYYAISAEDVRNNISEFSDRVQLMKPDTIPPGPGVFKTYKNDEKGIYLSWNPSSSRDAVRQVIERSAYDESIVVLDADMTTVEYLDKDVKSGVVYTYSIITEDDNGLRTMCPNPIKLRTSKLMDKPAISLQIKDGQDDDLLVYNVDSKQDLDKVIIYKSIGNKPYITHKVYKEEEQSFSYDSKEKASYKAIAITKNGIQSDASIIKIK